MTKVQAMALKARLDSLYKLKPTTLSVKQDKHGQWYVYIKPKPIQGGGEAR